MAEAEVGTKKNLGENDCIDSAQSNEEFFSSMFIIRLSKVT